MTTPETSLPFHALPARSAAALDLLAGIKVLDLTTSVAGPYAGPYAGQLLADLGATVEPRTGDDARAWGPPVLHGQSLWFMSVNCGKHSVTIDIGSPAGQEILHRLVTESATGHRAARSRTPVAAGRPRRPDSTGGPGNPL